jgi:hypothetical protein
VVPSLKWLHGLVISFPLYAMNCMRDPCIKWLQGLVVSSFLLNAMIRAAPKAEKKLSLPWKKSHRMACRIDLGHKSGVANAWVKELRCHQLYFYIYIFI